MVYNIEKCWFSTWFGYDIIIVINIFYIASINPQVIPISAAVAQHQNARQYQRNHSRPHASSWSRVTMVLSIKN